MEGVGDQMALPAVGKKRAVLLLLQSLLGLSLLLAWLKLVPLGELRAYYGRVELTYLPPALGLFLAAASLRAMRWKVLLRPLARLSFREAFAIGLSGALLNYLVPLRLGELAKSWLVRQRHGVPVSRSLPAVLVDRYLDFSALMVAASLALVAGLNLEGHIRSLVILGVSLVVGLVIAIALVVLLREHILSLARGALRHLSSNLLGPMLLEVISNFLEGLSSAKRSPFHLVVLFGLSLLALGLDGVFYYLLFLAFQSVPPFSTVFVGYVLLTLTYLLPAAPGYIGSTEAFGSLIFSALGMDITLAASVVVLGHVLISVVLLAGGGASLYFLQRSLLSGARSVERRLTLGELQSALSRSREGAGPGEEAAAP